jgi:hypothetical protein
VLSFKNHIRRRGGTVARTARDLHEPSVVQQERLVDPNHLI